MIKALIRISPHRTQVLILSVLAMPPIFTMIMLRTSSDSGLRFGIVFTTLCILAFYTVLAGVIAPTQSCRRIDALLMTLPVPPAQAYRARFLAILGSVLTPIAVAGIVVTALAFSAGENELCAAVLGVFGTVVISIVAHLLLSFRACDSSLRLLSPLLFVMAPGLAAAYYFPLPWVGSTSILLAIIVGIYTWVSAPSQFAAASIESASSSQFGIDQGHSFARNTMSAMTVRDPLWMLSLIPFAVLLLVVFTMPFPQIIWAPFAGIILFTINTRGAQVLRRIGHLPVDRRQFAPVVVLPSICLGLLVLGTAAMTQEEESLTFSDRVSLKFEEVQIEGKSEFYTSTDVPGLLKEVHWGFGAPVLEDASGKRHDLKVKRAVSFLPIGTYNPYEIPYDASLSLACSQVQQMLRTAFGVDVSTKEIADQYLEIGRNGLIDKRSKSRSIGEISLGDRFEDLRIRTHPNAFVLPLVVFIVLWFAVGLFSFRQRQYPRVKMSWKKSASAWVIGAVALTLIMISVATLDDLPLALLQALRSSIPTAPWLSAILIVCLAALASVILMRRFCTMDLPPVPKAMPIEKAIRRRS